MSDDTDKTRSKLVLLEGLMEPDEMRIAMDSLKRNLAEFKEFQSIIAEIRMASYNAHIAQGFTPEQALELCKVATL